MVKMNLHFKLYKKRLAEKNDDCLTLKKNGLINIDIYFFLMSEPHRVLVKMF